MANMKSQAQIEASNSGQGGPSNDPTYGIARLFGDAKAAVEAVEASVATKADSSAVPSTEQIQDLVAAMLVAGSGVSLSYNDAAGTLTITASGGGGGLDAEGAQDAVGTIMAGSGLASVAYDDAAGTITVTVTSESVQDVVGALLVAGSGITVAYDDAGNALTVTNSDRGSTALAARTVSAGTGLSGGGALSADRSLAVDVEWLMDYLSGSLVAGSNVTLTYDDTAGTITVASSGGGTVADGSITSAKIADDAITAAKIAANAVTNAKLATASQATVKGVAQLAGTSTPTDLTATQLNKITGLDVVRAANLRGYATPPTVCDHPPALTLSASGASTALSGSTKVIAPNSTVFKYEGAAYTNVGTISGFTNCYRQTASTHSIGSSAHSAATSIFSNLLNVSFVTSASDFEIVLRVEEATAGKYKVWVNEQFVATQNTIGTAGNYYRVRVSGGELSRRSHNTIRVEGQEVTFMGVVLKVKDEAWQPKGVASPVAVAMMDSYGAHTSTSWCWDNFCVKAGRALGWDVHPNFVSGSGFYHTYSGFTASKNYPDRIATDVTPINPDIVIVQGSINDVNDGASDATIQTAINSTFNGLRTALPTARIIGLGVPTPQDSYTTKAETYEGYITTATAAVGGDYIKVSDWINGTGYEGATTGVGNSDDYIATDAAHLTTAGDLYMAERLSDALAGDFTRSPAPVSKEILQDLLYSTLTAGSGITLTYDDTAGTLAVAASGGGGGFAHSACRAYRTTNMALTTGAETSIQWTHEEFDDASYHSTSSNTQRFTAPATGRYRLEGNIYMVLSSGTLEAYVGIKKNGAYQSPVGTSLYFKADNKAQSFSSGPIELTAGDYIEVYSYVVSGTSVEASAATTFVTFERLS